MSDTNTSTTQATQQSLPRLNEPAPQFAATSTMGPIKLSDYKGKWVLLFSHPADFTPVCTTEFAAFSSKFDEFEKRGVQLIGLSIDSIFSHLAWMRNIEGLFNTKIKFPVIADLDMKVSQAYGMVHPGASATETVRCVFVIDPNQTVRAMIYYPLSTGRNIEEIIRLIDALQFNTREGLATPANWKPGDACVVPAPRTMADVDKRMKEGYDTKEWYLSMKKMS